MIVLALDTALAACSVALVDITAQGVRVLARYTSPMLRGHAEALAPMIAAAMDQARSIHAGFTFFDIDRIAVTTGPGTFTGVRVAVATARGLALAMARPAVGVGTLEAYAAQLAENSGHDALAFAVVLDARRDEVYVQVFDADGRATCAPAVLAPEAAADLVGGGLSLFGSGAPVVAEALRARGLAPAGVAGDLPPGPDPVAIARLGAAMGVPATPPSPFYLRPPDAKPQAGGLARLAAGAGMSTNAWTSTNA